jgi:recombination protein RecR
MIEKVPTLAQLCKTLQQVPYLASKNLYRVVTYFLMAEEKKINAFVAALQESRAAIILCPTCCVWRERNKLCVFCDDPKRDATTICVVETWQELLTIEKTEGYKGLYHVLGGVISPLDGIGPEDLSIEKLTLRISPMVKEIILATNQTPEGEATAAYIARRLKDSELKVSCLARGIPVGSSIELMDKLTVYKALFERRPF